MKSVLKFAALLGAALAVKSVIAEAPAQPRLVRVFFNTSEPTKHEDGKWHAGDIVPARLVQTILFLKEPCPLPADGADKMLRAWRAAGAYQLGCWYPSLDDHYVFVGRVPQLTRASQVYWEMAPHAVLNPDGSATITEPNYNSHTFMAEVNQRKVLEFTQHRNERP